MRQPRAREGVAIAATRCSPLSPVGALTASSARGRKLTPAGKAPNPPSARGTACPPAKTSTGASTGSTAASMAAFSGSDRASAGADHQSRRDSVRAAYFQASSRPEGRPSARRLSPLMRRPGHGPSRSRALPVPAPVPCRRSAGCDHPRAHGRSRGRCSQAGAGSESL